RKKPLSSLFRFTFAVTLMSAGFRWIFAWLAASPIAPPKQAEYPAAKSCSGLVPGPCDPGGDRARSILPSGLVALPSRPAVAPAVSDASTVMAVLRFWALNRMVGRFHTVTTTLPICWFDSR